MILRMVLKKKSKLCLGNFKAVKIHPICNGLAKPQTGVSVQVVDGLVGVARPLTTGCIFTTLKYSKICFGIFSGFM